MKANTFFALMFGVAAGVAIGMMIAPENGEENRKKFRSKVEDFLVNLNSETAKAEPAAATAAEPAGEAEAPANE